MRDLQMKTWPAKLENSESGGECISGQLECRDQFTLAPSCTVSLQKWVNAGFVKTEVGCAINIRPDSAAIEPNSYASHVALPACYAWLFAMRR